MEDQTQFASYIRAN